MILQKKLITTKPNRKTNYILGLMLNHKIRRIIFLNENNYIGSILQEKNLFMNLTRYFKTI